MILNDIQIKDWGVMAKPSRPLGIEKTAQNLSNQALTLKTDLFVISMLLMRGLNPPQKLSE